MQQEAKQRRKHLRETLPVWNLTEALDQVANRVHTTPEQRLMSITTIARQAQGVRVGEVIAKLAEDAYFMRVNSRVTQVPPLRTHEPRHREATSCSPADGGRNRSRGEQPQNPNHSRVLDGGPSQGGNSVGGAGGSRGGASRGDSGGGGSSSGSSSTVLAGELVAAAIAEAEATQTATSPASHTAAMMPTT
jgi:hypothetical protein